MKRLLPALVVLLAAGTSTEAGELPPAAKKAFDDGFALSKEPGRLRDAIQQYEVAIKAAPDSWDVWLEYTGLLRRAGRLERAAQAGWRTMELKEDVDGWVNLGNVFTEAGAFDSAILAYKRSGELGNFAHKVQVNLETVGWNQITRGQAAEGLKTLEAVLAENPKMPKAAVDRGLALGVLGKNAEARKSIEAGIALGKEVNQPGSVKYGELLLKSMDKSGRLYDFYQGPSPQPLPARFLSRPKAGEALSLAIDPMAWHSSTIDAELLFAIQTPESWVLEEGKARRHGTSDLAFRPVGSPEFLLTVTGMGPTVDDAAISARLARSLDGFRSNAVEKAIPLSPIHGERAVGYSFFVTDKTFDWKNHGVDELPYMTQGEVAIDGHSVVFTLLTETKDPAAIGGVLKPALEARFYSLAGLAGKAGS